MRKPAAVAIALFVIACACFWGCAHLSTSETPSFVGTIQMVGNVPFATLAIVKEDGSMVRIRPSGALEGQFMSRQGKKVRVRLGQIEQLHGEPVFLVDEAEFIP
jgi:hypothetical protein